METYISTDFLHFIPVSTKCREEILKTAPYATENNRNLECNINAEEIEDSMKNLDKMKHLERGSEKQLYFDGQRQIKYNQIIVNFPKIENKNLSCIGSVKVLNIDTKKIKYIMVETYTICKLGISIKVLVSHFYEITFHQI
ncbi:hypothetical protein HZS_3675 [Henneguya salminicola]|nr:hypothetical protein HZS_3675 [Henneguya salminicola]